MSCFPDSQVLFCRRSDTEMPRGWEHARGDDGESGGCEGELALSSAAAARSLLVFQKMTFHGFTGARPLRSRLVSEQDPGSQRGLIARQGFRRPTLRQRLPKPPPPKPIHRHRP